MPSRTFDDPGLKSTGDRWYFYGQNDHVRLFGKNIEARLQAAGFSGRLVSHNDILSDVEAVNSA